MQAIDGFFNDVNWKLAGYIENKYVHTTLALFFMFYGALIAPTNPHILAFFNHAAVKFFLAVLVVLFVKTDIRLALLIATVFVIIHVVYPTHEGFSDFKKEYKSATTSRIIESRNHINFRCLKIKMADLVQAFDGDVEKLQTTLRGAYKELLLAEKSQDAKQRLMKAAYSAGLPYNVEFTDESAPFIATILTQWGYVFPKGCQGV